MNKTAHESFLSLKRQKHLMAASEKKAQFVA